MPLRASSTALVDDVLGGMFWAGEQPGEAVNPSRRLSNRLDAET
jgi:hypothetical protein